MEKIVLKNHIANIIIGALFIIAAVLGYFMNWIEDYLPIIVGAFLILLSLKRFLFSFKRLVSKNATLILTIELLLDFLFGGLLIYLGIDYVALFVGLIIYSRGVSYLIINYVATRKVDLVQYLINIGFVTFGAFLMFTQFDSQVFLELFVSGLILLIGLIFLQSGIVVLVKKEKQEEIIEKLQEKQEETAKMEKKIEKLEEKVKHIDSEKKKIEETKKELDQELKPKPKAIPPKPKSDPVVKPAAPKPKVDLNSKTVAELKDIALQNNMQGYSKLNKAQLIAAIEKHLAAKE